MKIKLNESDGIRNSDILVSLMEDLIKSFNTDFEEFNRSNNTYLYCLVDTRYTGKLLDSVEEEFVELVSKDFEIKKKPFSRKGRTFPTNEPYYYFGYSIYIDSVKSSNVIGAVSVSTSRDKETGKAKIDITVEKYSRNYSIFDFQMNEGKDYTIAKSINPSMNDHTFYGKFSSSNKKFTVTPYGLGGPDYVHSFPFNGDFDALASKVNSFIDSYEEGHKEVTPEELKRIYNNSMNEGCGSKKKTLAKRKPKKMESKKLKESKELLIVPGYDDEIYEISDIIESYNCKIVEGPNNDFAIEGTREDLEALTLSPDVDGYIDEDFLYDAEPYDYYN